MAERARSATIEAVRRASDGSIERLDWSTAAGALPAPRIGDLSRP